MFGASDHVSHGRSEKHQHLVLPSFEDDRRVGQKYVPQVEVGLKMVLFDRKIRT
jgi:hypothetical protein